MSIIYINPYQFAAAPVGGLLLDDYPAAAAAYSLRQLRTGVINVVRVRRSSDNTESDFTATQVSDGTLAAWVGAGNNGFVRIWYDQSGNGEDADQVTASSQPSIVSGGSLITDGTNPAILFAPNNTDTTIQLINSAIFVPQPFTIFVYANRTSTLDRQTLIGDQNNSVRLGVYVTGSVTFYAGIARPYQPIATAGKQLHYALGNSSLSEAAVNNDSPTASNAGTNAITDLIIGSTAGTTRYAWIGHISEMIIYPSDKSTDRSNIASNINAYYSIY